MYFILALATWNFIVFLMYGLDKRKAKKNKYRISENMLIGSAFFMGAVGAMFGMWGYRHKTKHIKFLLLLPLSLVVNSVVVWYFVVYLIK